MPFIFNENEAPGLIFIDGDHRKDKLLENFSYLVRKAGENTVIVIDDINYSKEMNEAWNELKSGDGISVTIDIFRMGLVFFRSGMSRFDYVVGY
jgi:hypothetical protein